MKLSIVFKDWSQREVDVRLFTVYPQTCESRPEAEVVLHHHNHEMEYIPLTNVQYISNVVY